MSAPIDVDDPRAPRRRTGVARLDRYAWLFTRFSGIALAVLVLTNVFVTLIWDGGVYRIDFNYVAQRWHSPVWRVWDLLLLWLAELHGGIGLRTIVDDYSRKRVTRLVLNTLLAVSMTFILALGTYVLLTFDPNIPS
jgi:succinate dehydrogenase / fumarate reductase membrane anchor subunit